MIRSLTDSRGLHKPDPKQTRFFSFLVGKHNMQINLLAHYFMTRYGHVFATVGGSLVVPFILLQCLLLAKHTGKIAFFLIHWH